MNFQIIYYIPLTIFVVLLFVFLWGWYFFNKPKINNKFLNWKLLLITLIIEIIGLIISIFPIIMKIWKFEIKYIKTNPFFLTLLIFEYLFLIIMLGLSYIFSFDFGITISENEIYFFGQKINNNNIIKLKQNKKILKIIYIQDFNKSEKCLNIITKKAQVFIKKNLLLKNNNK